MWPWQEDLGASLPESHWFQAELHVQELDNFMSAWTGPQDLTCLDVFGYSGSIAKCWRREGFTSEQYDIGLNRRSHDLLGKRGFLHLCRCWAQSNTCSKTLGWFSTSSSAFF